MKLYSQDKDYKLYQGNMLDMLKVIEPSSIDAIITDPLYGLTSITKRVGKENSAPIQYGKDGSFQRLTKGFMGQEWDGSGIEYNTDTWVKCYDALKAGGYLLAFGGTRTFHRIACAIEDAGFEIRDTIMWLYGSGFPKSLNIGLAIDKRNGVESLVIGEKKQTGAKFKLTQELIDNGGFNDPNREKFTIKEASNEWAGWGTQLKPAYEPIIVARKPVEGSAIDNVIKYGVGGINIDECRIPLEDNYKAPVRSKESQDYVNSKKGSTQCDFGGKGENAGANEMGRYPANVILTYDESDEQEVCGGMPNTTSGSKMSYGCIRKKQPDNCYKLGFTQKEYNDGQNAPDNYGDSGSAARYYYCAKATTKDRDEGLDDFEDVKVNDGREKEIDNAYQRGEHLEKIFTLPLNLLNLCSI